jgi:cytochrome c-type protein NapC
LESLLKKKSLYLVALLFFLTGILFWGSFNWSMELTNSESFCISCHEMRDNVYPEYKKSVHFANRTGVQASCPDCHVPKEWSYKLLRKIRAVNEIYHTVIGSVDTVEKFNKKRPVLASQVWKTMRETDSRECRNCHNWSSMLTDLQKPKARIFHNTGVKLDKTCIDCHQGIAHQLPSNSDKEQVIDEVHAVIESEKFRCVICHEDMPTPPENENWDWDN